MSDGQPVSASVQLLRFTPGPDQLVASAAKLCYASDTSTVLTQEEGTSSKFVSKLKSIGHMSPIEHVVFTFYIEGVSRACTHQLVRHRMASYSQRSQRYVSHGTFDYITPPRLAGRKVTLDGREIDAEEYYRETMGLLAERYNTLNRALGNSGESSNEDARYVLPNACETKIFVTMNARELLHILEERLCQRAQWEIRDVAEKMLALAAEVCPAVFENAGPKCVRLNYCPEKKMSCGRFKEMLTKYRSKETRHD